MTFATPSTIRSLAFGALGLAAFCNVAIASEGGGTLYPNGAEGPLAGALPPPGLYGMVYTQHYHANRVNDSSGRNLNLPGFGVTANVVAPRLAWVTGAKVLGGDLVVHTIVPLVSIETSMAGRTQRKTGVGDITVGAGLGYHHSQNLHSVVALDTYWPTGNYTKGDLTNIGRNYGAVEPVYALSYVNPHGWNGDFKAGWLINLRNAATDYRSGQEFHFDYSIGWAFGNGLTLGLGGYYWKQVTDDRQWGSKLADSKGETLAIGPMLKYDSGKGWFLALKWQKEVRSYNRAQGDAFWLKAVFPL